MTTVPAAAVTPKRRRRSADDDDGAAASPPPIGGRERTTATIMTTRRRRLRLRPPPLLLLLPILPGLVAPAMHYSAVAQSAAAGGGYLIGTGIHDMTGPAAEINLMGYARTTQTAKGIHLRLRSRAFIIAERVVGDDDDDGGGGGGGITSMLDDDDDAEGGGEVEGRAAKLRRKQSGGEERISRPMPKHRVDPNRTVCFVSIDAGMGSDLLTTRVLARLDELFPPSTKTVDGRSPCHRDNLSISGTHTHSAPGGFLQYALYQMTSLGFSEEVMDAYVAGVVGSILRAYSNLVPGTISTASGLLSGANINRSPTSYLLNPQEERDQYAETEGGDTDKRMVLLRFTGNDGTELGMLNWFAVHGTSMNYTNSLISGDNKGYASYLTEKRFNGEDALPGTGTFVAAFASTNLGDVSPNTAGPRCQDTGSPCDRVHSTCNGRTELCVASGPGRDMVESTEIIGRRQYEHAVSLFDGAGKPQRRLEGTVAFRHSFVDMSRVEVRLENGEMVRTCPAALGYSFAAGTTDGPGDFDFVQGTNTSNPFWNMISGFLSRPTQGQRDCQAPKPILLNTGRITLPYDWDPSSVPISIFRVGRLLILNVPSEFTTMAGRRLRRAVARVAAEHGMDGPLITIAGLANSYTHYVVTEQEYAGQRYEAASTLYGPYTLAAYIQEFERITRDLLTGRPSSSDAPPADLSEKQISLIPPVVFDTILVGNKYGDVRINAKESYVAGADEVFVSFFSSNPRSNQRIEGSFLSVDVLSEDGNWTTRYVDGDWSTAYAWNADPLVGWSFADITWRIPKEAKGGRYRICHFGSRRTLPGEVFSSLWLFPRLLGFNGMGSGALSVLGHIFDLALSCSGPLRRRFETLFQVKPKDFQGCSRTFEVRVGK